MKLLFKKLFHSFLTVIGVITVVFIFFNVIPADPAKIMLGQRDDFRQLENINKKYAFDKPLSHQYFYYLNDLSCISIHDNSNSDNYTYSGNYNYFTIIFFRISTNMCY